MQSYPLPAEDPSSSSPAQKITETSTRSHGYCFLSCRAKIHRMQCAPTPRLQLFAVLWAVQADHRAAKLTQADRRRKDSIDRRRPRWYLCGPLQIARNRLWREPFASCCIETSLNAQLAWWSLMQHVVRRSVPQVCGLKCSCEAVLGRDARGGGREGRACGHETTRNSHQRAAPRKVLKPPRPAGVKCVMHGRQLHPSAKQQALDTQVTQDVFRR